MTDFVKKVAAIILAVSALTPVMARAEMMEGEYFLNSDPGIGKATEFRINGGDAMSQVVFDAADFHPGINLLGIRVVNQGHWSTTLLSPVWVTTELSPVILAAEYFWDTDPGIGEATPLDGVAGNAPGASSLYGVAIPTSALADGRHLLGVRVKTAAGWSATLIDTVSVRGGATGQITDVEYFWDSDPGEGIGTQVAITPAREVTIDPLEISFPQDDATQYTLGIRGKTADGWGPVTYFTRENVPVSSVRLDNSELTLEKGNTATLNAEIVPEDALFRELDWKSDSENVFTVNDHGQLAGMSEGEGTLTVSSRRYPSAAATCAITVIDSHSSVEMTTADCAIEVTAAHGVLTITGPGLLHGQIINSGGQCMATFDTCSTYSVTLPRGIYIITVNSSTFKINIE